MVQAHVGRVLIGVGLLVGPSVPAVSAQPPGSDDESPTLHILLTVSPQLSETSRSELMVEATRLWRDAGVRLIWAAGSDGSVPPHRMLRVLVIPRRAGVRESPKAHVLGELLGIGRPGALAVASIDRAVGLVEAWRGPAIVPRALHDSQVGLVLGRVVAHEIGHYLLQTNTHARSGLMRATFETPALLNHRSPAFDLDAITVARLRNGTEEAQLSQR